MNTPCCGTSRQGRGMGRGRRRSSIQRGMPEMAQGQGLGRRQETGLDETPERDAERQQHVAAMRARIAASPRLPLSLAEQEDLLHMREEEKIARDVYLRLYDRWNIQPFANISGSEQAHMDAILALLEHFGLPDPAAGLAVGQFHNSKLQHLYDTLIAQGERSPEEAIRVGLLIEESDIDDLQKAARRTHQQAIRAVYDELERGSRNHLRAFYRWKTQLGVTYHPEHLSPEVFMATALSAAERCSLPAY